MVNCDKCGNAASPVYINRAKRKVLRRCGVCVEDSRKSIEARLNWTPRPHTKTAQCPCCDVDIYTKGIRAEYCSTECRRKHTRMVERHPKPCAHCGEDFTPKRSDAKYCCTKCRVYASRAA
jgi:hypothetical protein